MRTTWFSHRRCGRLAASANKAGHHIKTRLKYPGLLSSLAAIWQDASCEIWPCWWSANLMHVKEIRDKTTVAHFLERYDLQYRLCSLAPILAQIWRSLGLRSRTGCARQLKKQRKFIEALAFQQITDELSLTSIIIVKSKSTTLPILFNHLPLLAVPWHPPSTPPNKPTDAEQLRHRYSKIQVQQTDTWMHFWRIPKTQTICLLGWRNARPRRTERFKPRAAITFLANMTSLCLSPVGPAYRADTGERCHLGRERGRWKALRECASAKTIHRQTTSRASALQKGKKHRPFLSLVQTRRSVQLRLEKHFISPCVSRVWR